MFGIQEFLKIWSLVLPGKNKIVIYRLGRPVLKNVFPRSQKRPDRPSGSAASKISGRNFSSRDLPAGTWIT